MIGRWFRLGDKRGNVAVIAAVCAPVMMLMVGAAIDYGYALNINQRLNEAADTAVLSAISPSIAQGAGGYASAFAGGSVNAPMYKVARNTFATNTSALPISVSPNVNITSSTSSTNIKTYTATLTYSTSVPTFFASLVGLSSIPISGHAQATTTPLTYIRYFILIDISQSMGIAATAADMTNLYNRIEQYGQGTGGEPGCVFGCHVAESTQAYSNEDYAHNLSPYITLRIDSANTAVDSIIQTAIADENSTTPNISVGLYTMSALSSPIVTQVFAPTTNLAPYKTVAVDLGNNNAGGTGDSDFYDQITQFANTYLPAQGTGASASSPLNYVFLVTDGLVDTAGSGCTSGHCTEAFQPSYCNQLQAKATVGVIYTTYLPIYNYNNSADGYEVNYSQLVLPYVNQIPGNLQSCATSSNYYFQASYGSDIVAAMQSLFANSLQTVRLTQ
jgi:Flp pilus assembly protein TadG